MTIFASACAVQENSAGLQDPEESANELLAGQVKQHVTHLAETIGERNLDQHGSLCKAADYIQNQFEKLGLKPTRQTFQVSNLHCFNIIAEIRGQTLSKEGLLPVVKALLSKQ